MMHVSEEPVFRLLYFSIKAILSVAYISKLVIAEPGENYEKAAVTFGQCHIGAVAGV